MQFSCFFNFFIYLFFAKRIFHRRKNGVEKWKLVFEQE